MASVNLIIYAQKRSGEILNAAERKVNEIT